MKPLSAGPLATEHSGIREVVNVALTMKDVIRLEVGQPNFPTPEHILEATTKALRDGFTQYTATAGFLSLRELLTDKLARINKIRAEPSEINVTIGGTNAVAAALISILEAGDEVLSPDPAWPNYRLELSYSPAKMVTYPLHPAREFYPDPGELERLMTPRTKLLIINSPCNPTGSVFPKRVMEEIVRLCQKHDLYLISDECYDELIFEGEHVSPASFCDDGRVISVFTFSKTYAMTGFRVGYVVTNRVLADVINKMLEATMTCATSFAQKAAEAALKGPKDAVVKMVEAYKRRRDAVDILLREHEMWVTKPHGAFYVMADISRSGMDSRSFAFRLLEEAKVAVAPGTAFGKTVPNLVRLSLASEDSDLREGIERMSDFVRTVAMKR